MMNEETANAATEVRLIKGILMIGYLRPEVSSDGGGIVEMRCSPCGEVPSYTYLTLLHSSR